MYPYLKFHNTTCSLNVVKLKFTALQFGHTLLRQGESSVVSLSMKGVTEELSCKKPASIVNLGYNFLT